MHHNSQTALEKIAADGTLSQRAAEILRFFRAHPRAFTDREVAMYLRYPDMNCVRPRITELIERGLLREVDSVKCPVTSKTVRRVAPPAPQAELPL
jgi:hypothetical protein